MVFWYRQSILVSTKFNLSGERGGERYFVLTKCFDILVSTKFNLSAERGGGERYFGIDKVFWYFGINKV